MKAFIPFLILLQTIIFTACQGGASRSTAKPSGSITTSTPAALSPAHQSLPKIIAFGDSLTAGLGLSEAESYPVLLQQKLDRDGYKYEVVNAGVSGDTSAGGLRRIDWSLEGDVRVVILELGANDFLRGQPVAETKKNLRQIIERAKARGADVLLAGMDTPTSAGAEYRKDIQSAFQSLAREQNVILIPFFLDRVAGIDSLNQADRIHPNVEGTKIVAETVYRSLRPILDRQEQHLKK